MASVRIDQPFTLASPHGRSLTLPNRMLLAPMEGVTDRAFRGSVLDLGGVGAACTEFQRISVAPLSRRVLVRELGPAHPVTPVGIQIMAAEPDFVAVSAQRAERADAPFLDLNFGCPVRCVFGKGAGAALLDDPARIAAIVDAAVNAVAIPVTAKIRAGINDDSRLDEVIDAIGGTGAAGVTVHARLRSDSYAAPARWEWIRRVVARARASRTGAGAHPLRVIGNGGVEEQGDMQRMLDETACDAVMVGRAAMRDPFLFRRALGATPATRADALGFLHAYLDAMDGRSRYRIGRLKQLLRVYEAGALFGKDSIVFGENGAERRVRLLRTTDEDSFRALLFSA